jgi:hypothetical protein
VCPAAHLAARVSNSDAIVARQGGNYPFEESTLAQATFLAPEEAGKRLVGDRLPDEFGDIHDEV